ncbi:DMT family transporter [Thiomicrorhabdus sediminis]|uniref:DMT family transporter n=1 Tax=Thiomicrorhabdus sediminis TaxID=2580412 RepID=A0A4P9K6R3_9GAMM|nr:DMT family transporter [Thiomicrorhabdus sediminis]QCU89927.1 DMT family transporter [Thiomicrorhabdus sediminis]
MQSIAVWTLLGASILWGMTWLPLKYLHQLGFDGILITLWVYLLMFALAMPFVWRYRAYITPHWKPLLGVMLLGGGAQLAFNTSMIYGDVIRAMVLFYLIPLWGVLGGRIFLGELITPIRALGMVLSVFGAFLVVGGFDAFESPPTWIDALAIASGFLFAMNNITFRASTETPVMLKVPFMFLGAVLFSTLVVIAMQEPLMPSVSVDAWWILFAYAAIWMMLANLATQWAVTKMESGKSSIILILELVTAVVSASLILGETMSFWEMVGGGFILLAAMLETVPQNTGKERTKMNNLGAL